MWRFNILFLGSWTGVFLLRVSFECDVLCAFGLLVLWAVCHVWAVLSLGLCISHPFSGVFPPILSDA